MGGSIAIESAPDQGAAFRFTLPLRAGDSPASAFIPPSLTRRSVLIVTANSRDEDPLVRRLTRWGAEVTRASAATLPEAVATQSFDTALINLPPDAASVALRCADGRIARRIVLLAPSERPSLPLLKEAGSTGYLVKPVRAASLAARLTGDAPFEDAPVAEAPSAPQAGRSLAILVAEDNDINALLARSLLERLGHRPTMVTDGAAAIAAWRSAQAEGAPFDAVLMDVQMPGTDGLEATRTIRGAEADMNLPRGTIVALTANAFAEDRTACIEAGMDDFLVKPLDRDRLIALLARLRERAAVAA